MGLLAYCEQVYPESPLPSASPLEPMSQSPIRQDTRKKGDKNGKFTSLYHRAYLTKHEY